MSDPRALLHQSSPPEAFSVAAIETIAVEICPAYLTCSEGEARRAREDARDLLVAARRIGRRRTKETV